MTSRAKNFIDVVDSQKSKQNISIAPYQHDALDMTHQPLHQFQYRDHCYCGKWRTSTSFPTVSSQVHQAHSSTTQSLANGTMSARVTWHIPSTLQHWHTYTFLERIFSHFAEFASNFGNVNVVTESRPLTDLNIKPQQRALVVMRSWSTSSLWLNLPTLPFQTSQPWFQCTHSIMSPWNKHNIRPPPDVPVSNTPTPVIAEKPHRNKHGPVSPDEKAKAKTINVSISSSWSRQRTHQAQFHWRGGVYLHNPAMRIIDVFP